MKKASNTYTVAAACERIFCTRKEYNKLKILLKSRFFEHGFKMKYIENGAFLYSKNPDSMNPECLPKPFLSFLSKLLRNIDKTSLTVGYAYFDDINCTASCGGGRF